MTTDVRHGDLVCGTGAHICSRAGEPVADDDPRPSIFTAIKSQLGLELQSRKGPVTTVVIERIERPTEN